MLKKRDLHDSHTLFDLMTHPDVFPFVRQKAYSYEEYLFLTKQTIEAEEQGKMISRTITDEWGSPIGTINLFDINENTGFLGTWIGKPYHGKGYNKLAKDAFFNELFLELGIETVFMRIRKENVRSKRAAEKLPYCIKANEIRPFVYRQLNPNPDEEIYDLYEIPKDLFLFHLKRIELDEDMSAMEA
ncbi:MAG TPA: GNAT family N-acetyltransferase [Bacillus sp. (in: firmicutes)]|uniref:GNAT family N-acetyltransferase n=1 Tax=Bacillus litorisediminis TaxID=2922713 RepID=UPI001FADDCB4|nr:GNAT family N-acetyltransferase [Bacillus litorisediminis]HWO76261.1 GNAT family N-acetyltransferase [Bacillus sp. (in: firmicutes)]